MEDGKMRIKRPNHHRMLSSRVQFLFLLLFALMKINLLRHQDTGPTFGPERGRGRGLILRYLFLFVEFFFAFHLHRPSWLFIILFAYSRKFNVPSADNRSSTTTNNKQTNERMNSRDMITQRQPHAVRCAYILRLNYGKIILAVTVTSPDAIRILYTTVGTGRTAPMIVIMNTGPFP